jgi:hypothetical protein
VIILKIYITTGDTRKSRKKEEMEQEKGFKEIGW